MSRRIEFRGRPAILTVYRDMTERKRSEEAVREQARLMQQLLDAIPIPIIAKDIDGRLPLTNAAFAAGPAAGTKGPAGVTASWTRPTSQMHAAHDRPVLEEGAVKRTKRTWTPRRHGATPAPDQGPPPSGDGEIAGIVTAGLDISDRYRAEQELSQSEERFRTLFENAGDAMLIVDEKGRFLDANRAACERLGYSRGTSC